MTEPSEAFGHALSDQLTRPMVLLIAGFLSGIPTALSLAPRLMPLLPMWLNDLDCQIVIALIAGLAVGSISYIVLCLAEELRASRDTSPLAGSRELVPLNVKPGDIHDHRNHQSHS